MDRYDERIIKGKPAPVSFLLIALAVLLTIVGLVLFLVSPMLSCMVVFAGVAWIIFAKDGLDIEYEYILTNGDVEVAKILSKKRRKTMKEIESSSVTKIDYASSEYVKNDISLGKAKVRKYVGKEEEGKLIAIYTGDADHQTITLIDANDKMIDHLKAVYKVKCNL
ncbi:MAG: hypothetical protein J5517_08065 [Eubacterium sp.]|nr:hypothetical protein [Eubacterium sp.]